MRIFQKQDLSVCHKGTCDLLGSVVTAIVQLDPAIASVVVVEFRGGQEVVIGRVR